jgi:hypothetical protein
MDSAAKRSTIGEQPNPTISGMDHIFEIPKPVKVEAADLMAHFYPEVLEDPIVEEPVVEEPPKRIHLVQVVAPSSELAADSNALSTAMDTLLSRLAEAEQQLQSSSFRIGYLQAEIDKYKEEVKLLPDFELQARKAAEIERQNEELRKQLPELEQRTRRLALLQQENETLQLQLQQVGAYKGSFSIFRLFSLATWIDLLSRK